MIGGLQSTLLVSVFLWCVVFQSVVDIIMIDSSKTRKSLAGVDVQSPHVIERHSNFQRKFMSIFLSDFNSSSCDLLVLHSDKLLKYTSVLGGTIFK